MTPDYRVEVVAEPGKLDPQVAGDLQRAFATLSWRATGGPEWQDYTPGQKGWESYFSTEGARPQDYARLLLCYQGDELVHFTAIHLVRIPQDDITLLWYHFAMSHPDLHDTGLLARAAGALADSRWLGSIPGTVYLVLRTINPVVYEATRNLLRRYGATLCPNINDRGELDPVSEKDREMARRIAATISPRSEFDDERFIVKDYWARYGALYKDREIECRNAGTKAYFATALDRQRFDGIMAFGLIDPAGMTRGS